MKGPHDEDGILVVEDDTEIREILVETLEDHGYRASAAQHGREALERLRNDGLRPCIILLDLMMPVMDGQAFRAEQQRDPALADIPVVVISAYRDIEASARDMGAVRMVKKPINLPELLKVIGEVC